MLITKMDLRLGLLFHQRAILVHLTPNLMRDEMTGVSRYTTLRPVPITTQHLLLMGFSLNENGVELRYGDAETGGGKESPAIQFLFTLNNDDRLTAFAVNGVDWPIPDYIHQLQELVYFAAGKMLYHRGVI